MSEERTSQEVFKQMLERIGVEEALAIQMSIALKFKDAVQGMENATLTPQECAFLSIWIDSLVEMSISNLVLGLVEDDDPVDPTEIGRPGFRP